MSTLTASQSAQSTLLSHLRIAIGGIVRYRAELKTIRDTLHLYSDPPALDTAIYANGHGDLTNTDVQAAIAVLDQIEASLIDPQTHVPTAAALALAKLAQYS